MMNVYNTILSFFLNNGYSQIVHFPTRGCNFLDLVLTDVDMMVSNVMSHPPWVSVTTLQSSSQLPLLLIQKAVLLNSPEQSVSTSGPMPITRP